MNILTSKIKTRVAKLYGFNKYVQIFFCGRVFSDRGDRSQVEYTSITALSDRETTPKSDRK
jgi:hypothetical protein